MFGDIDAPRWSREIIVGYIGCLLALLLLAIPIYLGRWGICGDSKYIISIARRMCTSTTVSFPNQLRRSAAPKMVSIRLIGLVVLHGCVFVMCCCGCVASLFDVVAVVVAWLRCML
jgi:hypothetical protein